MRRPGVDRKDAAYLTAEQTQTLLDEIRGDRLEGLFRPDAGHGAAPRQGARSALGGRRPGHRAASRALKLDPHVPGSPARRAEDRQVPQDSALPRSAVETLQAHRARQEDDRRSAGHTWRDKGLVFTTEIGTPLEARNVLRRFEQLARRADLEGVHLHSLRHSAASFLMAAGIHTKVVQEHLGHSSYAITADIYSHVGPTLQREAADRLDQALRW